MKLMQKKKTRQRRGRANRVGPLFKPRWEPRHGRGLPFAVDLTISILDVQIEPRWQGTTRS